MTSSQLLLGTRSLTVGFGKTAILPPLDVDFRRGEIWGLVGRNGAGKTTFLRTLLGLHPPVGGRVERDPGTVIGYVPQRHAIDPLVPARARDLVAEGADRGWSFLRPLRPASERTRIAAAIEATHTESLLGRRYRDLSEGEKQRVLLARAIAGAPDLLILDEPTSAMDLVAERHVIETLTELRTRFGLGIVLVSHHLGLVAKMADRLLFLDSDDGVTVAGDVSEVLRHPHFARRYGAVLAAETIAASTPPPPDGAGGQAAEAP